MTDYPAICVYGPCEDAPEHMRYSAAMVADSRPGSHWMCTAASAEEARAKLEARARIEFPEPRKGGPGRRKKETAEDFDIV